MKLYSKLCLLLSLLALTLACQPTASDQPAGSAEESTDPVVAAQRVNDFRPVINQKLEPTAFADTLATISDEQLIDVRTPAEYQTGHLPHSTLINYKNKDFRDKIAQLDKGKPVMVYCAAGGRSTAAAALLEELGFPKVYELEGGITRWRDAGQAVEQ